jgi:hypothetical protein
LEPTFTTGLLSFPLGKVTTYTDAIGTNTQPLFYCVFASNIVGSTVAGYPQARADSDLSNVQGVNPVLPPSNLTGTLQAGPQSC